MERLAVVASMIMARFVQPVDDEAHEHVMNGTPVAAATLPTGDAVEFWAELNLVAPGPPRRFRIFGTGHQLPPNVRWVATCRRHASGLVWHLYEVM